MNIIIYCFLFLMLSILVVAHFLFYKNDIEESYLFNIKKNRIDWGKVLKLYIISNVFIYIASINNELMDLIDIILMPILFVSFILTYWFVYPDPDTRQKAINKIDQKDFEKYKKSWNDKEIAKKREEKINKILK